MSEVLFSVEFAVDENDRAAIQYAGPRIVGPHGFRVDPPSQHKESALWIDVRANDPIDAGRRAIALYQEMRDLAQLQSLEHPKVASVAFVAGVPHPADLFIFEAQEMAQQQRFGLAVIAAQTHCEMHVWQTVERVARAKGLTALLDEGANWSLVRGYGPKVFETLTGVAPKTAPCWKRYREHVERRNRCAHRGEPVDRVEAEASIQAAVDMVRFVDEAERMAITTLDVEAPD